MLEKVNAPQSINKTGGSQSRNFIHCGLLISQGSINDDMKVIRTLAIGNANDLRLPQNITKIIRDISHQLKYT